MSNRRHFTTLEIAELIATGNEKVFYNSRDWYYKRKEVLELDRYECQRCKENNIYTKAYLVHHIKHLKDRPDLALSTYDIDGSRQLISLCNDCHEKEHPERHRFKGKDKDKEFKNEEKW